MSNPAPQYETLTTFQNLLKESYDQAGEIKNVRLKIGPLATMLLEDLDNTAGGYQVPFPIIYGGGAGRSADIGTAVANASPATNTRFVLTLAKNYQITDLDALVLQASENPDLAYLESKVTEVANGKLTLMESLAQQLYGDGTGVIGQVGAVTGSTGAGVSDTLTLVSPSDGAHFGQYMWFNTSTTPNNSGVRTGGSKTNATSGYNSTQCTGIPTLNLNVAVIAAASGTLALNSVTAGDYVFTDGDLTSTSFSNYAGVLTGLAGWFQTGSLASSDSFFNVNRSLSQYLQGSVFNGQGLDVQEALNRAVAQAHFLGGDPDAVFISTRQWMNLSLDLQAKNQYYPVRDGGDGDFGFSALRLITPSKAITVYGDRWCSDNVGYLLQMDTLQLISTSGGVPFIASGDGLTMLRLNALDQYEVRQVYYAQLGCRAPIWNTAIIMPAAQ